MNVDMCGFCVDDEGGNGHRNRARRGQIQLGKQQEDTDLVYERGKEGD